MGPWPIDPQGPQARAIAELYWIMFGAAIVVLVIVDGALIYAGIKFRERPGHRAAQFHSHNVLELLWTVIPTLMVISFAVLSFQKLDYINDTASGAEITVQVSGRQWSWTYKYPQQPMFRLADGTYLQGAEELHIPVNTKVRLELSAQDVIHSYFVPSLGGKKDAVPGRQTDMWIQADRPGSYKGQCAEFCGDGHADMLLTIVVHAKDAYAKWAESAVAEANRLSDPATKKGRETFLALACVGCHTVQGTTAAGKVGPELTHVASKKSIAGGVLSPVNAETLTRWIKNPPAVKPGTQMPNLGLADEQVRDIVTWLLTLK